MKKARFRTVAAICVFTSLAMATPARAASACDLSPELNWYSWFAHTFGYCN